jgi:hypothetical protein
VLRSVPGGRLIRAVLHATLADQGTLEQYLLYMRIYVLLHKAAAH